jgi:hypothetical protein
MMMFEEAGKTILQPLVTNQEAQRIKKLLHHKTLEVWLPNGNLTLNNSTLTSSKQTTDAAAYPV